MGDRWVLCLASIHLYTSTDQVLQVPNNLMRSTYVWLPLQISGSTASLTWYINWTINPSTGAWAGGPSETSKEGEAAAYANQTHPFDAHS